MADAGDTDMVARDNAGFVTSGDVRTALIEGVTFARRAVQYSVVDGRAIFEGDIVLGTVEEVEQRSAALADQRVDARGVGRTGRKYRWPGGLMPFTIDPNLTDQQRLRDAVAHWEEKTRLRFVERTEANSSAFPNFLAVVPSNECSCLVGMQGGRQELRLTTTCTKGNTIHEIGHAWGLWHEQSREDRDSFVTINWANVEEDAVHNFNQHISDGDDIGPYDYGSIMHYGRRAFARNVNEDTIVPIQSGVTIGQRDGLSQGDIDAVHALYASVDRTAEHRVPSAAGSPTPCVIPGLGVHNIAYRDTSGRLHELWRDAQGRTGTTNLTANAGAPTATGNPFAYADTTRNTEILLFRGSDGIVRSLYWSTGAVGHDDLGGTARAPKAAGDPVGYHVPAADMHHVIYRSGDGHLHELWWAGVAPVAHGGDLTALASAPNATGQPSAFANRNGENIVVYRATDGHVRSLYWSTGAVGHDDLSGYARTPAAAGDPVAYYTAHDDTHQIAYCGSDGHIYELYWPGVAPVVGWNLTVLAGAPRAVGNLAAYYSAGTNTKHVIYRSADGRLHELWWVPGGGTPAHVDLTRFASLSAAPLAGSAPAAFTVEGPNTQHVTYRGTDGHIYEMRW